jgi:hypothetical protein
MQATRRDFDTIDDTPLSIEELALIWRSLPERKRFPFILALDEKLCDALVNHTARRARVTEPVTEGRMYASVDCH